MGTHPIFESDFDCLTEKKTKKRKKSEEKRKYGLEKKSFAQGYYFGGFGRWEDVADEPVCQQEIYFSVQGNYRSRFSNKRSVSRRSNGHLTNLGYGRSRTISITRCCLLPRCRLLCFSLRYNCTELFQITRIVA